MNLQEIKAKLDKINRYYEFLVSIPEPISQLDRDAFLMQLRELYDAALFDKVSPVILVQEPIIEKQPEPKEIAAPKEEEQPKKEEPIKKVPTLVFTQPETQVEEKKELPIVTQKNEPVVEKEEPKVIEVEPVKIEPKVEPIIEKQPEPVVEKKEEPKVIEAEPVKIEPKVEPVIEKKEEPKVIEKVEPVVEKKEEPVKVEPKVEPVKEEPKIPVAETPKAVTFNEEYEELFVFKQATDLAAKLSESPVSNLNKVLGVNEKLYYINSLFGGDVAKFNEVVVFFNDAGLFDKARAFMEQNLIEQYTWMSREKKSIAKEFVKLIRRRYL